MLCTVKPKNNQTFQIQMLFILNLKLQSLQVSVEKVCHAFCIWSESSFLCFLKKSIISKVCFYYLLLEDIYLDINDYNLLSGVICSIAQMSSCMQFTKEHFAYVVCYTTVEQPSAILLCFLCVTCIFNTNVYVNDESHTTTMLSMLLFMLIS